MLRQEQKLGRRATQSLGLPALPAFGGLTCFMLMLMLIARATLPVSSHETSPAPQLLQSPDDTTRNSVSAGPLPWNRPIHCFDCSNAFSAW